MIKIQQFLADLPGGEEILVCPCFLREQREILYGSFI